VEELVRARLDLPQPIVPVFWGLLFLEATFGAYTSVWPLWIERLGAPVAIVGFMLGIGGFLRLFVLAPSAALADRFGYRRMIVIARLMSVAGLTGAAFSTHWTQLLLVVLALAVGEMVFPLVQTIVAAEAGSQRMRSFALVFNVGPSIALAIAPLISAGMVALLGMRSAFVLGAIFSALSVYCFTRIAEPEVAAASEATPPSYQSALQEPSVRLVGSLLLVTIFSLSLGISFIPTFLEDVRGFEPAEIAALGALPAIGSAIYGLGVARIRTLQRMPFIAAAISTGLMSIAFVILRETAVLPLLAIAFLLRGGMFATWATLISALGELAPARLRSRSFALLEMIGGLAFSLGPMVAGLLYARKETLPFEIATLFALALVPVYVLAQRRANTMPKVESGAVVGTEEAGPTSMPSPQGRHGGTAPTPSREREFSTGCEMNTDVGRDVHSDQPPDHETPLSREGEGLGVRA
jgi:MFS family permease